MQLVDWDDLRTFHAIATARSLTEAARALGMDTATVSRRLAAFELRAGATLVRRSVGAREGSRLTAAGTTLAKLVASVALSVREVETWHDRPRATSVRLTAPEELVALLLAPALPRLAAVAPDVELELIGRADNLDLLRGEADLALRLSRPREPGLVSRRAAALGYSVYRAREASAVTSWLSLDDSVGVWPELQWTRARLRGRRPILRATSLVSLAAAAGAGLGLAILPDALAALDPRLACIEPNVGERTLWLVLPTELRTEPSVRVVIDWAISALLPLRATPLRTT